MRAILPQLEKLHIAPVNQLPVLLLDSTGHLGVK